jgi:ribose transport system permease protein
VGPLTGFMNVLMIIVLGGNFGITSHWVLVPSALLVGAINGLLTAIVSIQPIVETLGTYLVLSEVTLV